MRALAAYTRARHYPELADAPAPDAALFDAIVERQARLVARWQAVGFIHGVMNTDNMALSGETIDYGPCAFMDAYDPRTVFSSIDSAGRYAYGQQPAIAQWNLARLAEAMLPLLDPETERAVELANAALERFAVLFDGFWLDLMRAKLGLFEGEEGDRALAEDLLAWMQLRSADFTGTFRSLALGERPPAATSPDEAFDRWEARWLARRARQRQPAEASVALMRRHNPAVIPRNHRVEEALHAATAGGDLTVLHRLVDELTAPFDYQRWSAVQDMPPPQAQPYRTFCGT
jgi:uncharacterized protein YdiU (UPF0061 family)